MLLATESMPLITEQIIIFESDKIKRFCKQENPLSHLIFPSNSQPSCKSLNNFAR
jgi:hypothetical protein